MDPVQAMFSSMAGAGMMGGPSVMMNIPSSRNTFNEFKFEEEQILSETGSHVSEKDTKIEEDFEKLKGDKDKDKDKEKSKGEEDYDSYSEESYTESEEDEKDEKDEKVEKVDVKKININDGMSVSELKAICKSKNLLKEYYSVIFEWLKKCESLFGFKDLTNYDKTRILKKSQGY